MSRDTDGQEVIDDEEFDSGSYDVRELRGRRLDPEEVELIAKVVRKMQPQVVNNEGSSNGFVLKWILGAISSLIVASILGAIGFYGVVEALRATVQANGENTNRRLDRIENRLDGRSGITRGGAGDSSSP